MTSRTFARTVHLNAMETMQTLERTWTPDAAAAWARELYDGAVDRRDAAGFAAAFTDDGWLRFGNNEPLVGRANIEAAIAGFFTMLDTLKHQQTGLWSQGDALILEANVTYRRLDGGMVTVPAVTIMRLAGTAARPVVERCQMFVDLTPLFAPA